MTSDSPPATVVQIPTAMVRREIWRSLISMLSVYASLESLGGGETVVVEKPGKGQAVVEQGGRRLTLCFEIESGSGRWALAASTGEFTISEAGSLEVDRRPAELDTAAIEWLDMLRRRSGQPQL